MKRLTALLLAMTMLLTVSGALAADAETKARSVVPSGAELVRKGMDDGMTVYHFRTAEGETYEVDTDPSGNVVHVDMDAPERGGTKVILTPEQAQEQLLLRYPGASVTLVYQERDDGRFSYEVFFSTEEAIGRAEFNAETGKLTDLELDYTSAARVQAQGPLTADEAKALVLSLVSEGRIREFETDREDGRKVYEGEVSAQGNVFEFVIDAETGRITEWQRDH